MKISVNYSLKDIELENRDNMELDSKITAALEAAGFKWYAQGLEVDTGIRDIAFDAPEEVTV